MAESEVLKLRKELLHARETIEDLQEELRLTDEKCLRLQEEYSHGQELVQQARQDLEKIDSIVEQKVAERVAQEIKNRESLEELVKEKNELIERLKDEQDKLLNRERMIMRDYDYLKGKMEETMGGNFEMQDALREVKRGKEEREAKEKDIERLVAQLNELSKQTEDLIAENRVLREMANAPENFGIPINEIKLAEKEKLEEYKVKLRHYEEEIHTLERERAILKARLRERPTIPGKEEFTRGLSPDQILVLEQFIADLREGKEFQPIGGESAELRKENERLRGELARAQKAGAADLEKMVERAVMKRSQGRVAEPQGDELLEKIQRENAELLRNIKDMMKTGPVTTGEIVEAGLKRPETGAEGNRATPAKPVAKQLSRHLYPPEPIKKADGSVTEGKSFRFQGEPIPVVPFDMERYSADKINKEEFAFMQLALIEAIELGARKDVELKSYTNNFQNSESKIRNYLLQRNELYKDYSKLCTEYKDSEKSFKEQNAELTDLLRAEKIKNCDLEKLLSAVQSGMKESDLSAQLLEQTKKSSILEVSMMQLTRKYLTLQDEYRLIHGQYMNGEKVNKERELQLEERILKLKEWKAKAVLELKYLYNKLRTSVPATKYERQRRELEVMKEKEMQWVEATQELMLLKSDRVGTEREKAEFAEQLNETKAMLTDAEQELQLVNSRLKRRDPQYAYERAVFERVIDSFKTYRMSPQEAFEMFDKNHSGSISREEFRSILAQLHLDLSSSDLESVMKFLDTDSSGSIRYKAFIRTLKRYGIKSKTKEDEVITKIAETLGRTGTDLQKTFEVLDRDGDNLINRQEMLDALTSMRLGIKEDDLVSVLSHIYPEGTSGIDYRRFCRVFEKSKLALSNEEKSAKNDWKTELLRRIDEKLMEQKLPLQSAFETDKDGIVTKDSFAKTCAKLGLVLTGQELNEVYAEFDPKGTGAAFADIAVGIISAKSARVKSGFMGTGKARDYEGRGFGEESDLDALKTKVMILQEREKIATEKARREAEQVKPLQELVKKRTEECESLEKRLQSLNDQLSKSRKMCDSLDARLANCVSKAESVELKGKYEAMERELLDKEAAMQTYKGMYEAVVQQMRSLELAFGRKRDEVNELHKALLEIQSGTDKDNLIGKLYYVVLLSRWQEGATNRKYDALVNDIKHVKAELYTTETNLAKKEDEISHAETRLRDATELLTGLQEKAKEKDRGEYSQEKFKEVTVKMKELIQGKIDTELVNIKLREENTKMSYLVDQLELEKKQAQELAEVLRYKNSSEIAQKFAELSDKTATLKLSELRAQRDAKLGKEKETYLERVNSQYVSQIKKLEEELGILTASLQKAEENYREKDKERERLFFELKQQQQAKPRLSIDEDYKNIPIRETGKKSVSGPSVPAGNNSELVALLREKDETIARLQAQVATKTVGPEKSLAHPTAEMDTLLREEEKRQMADVAYKTIKTLESIINNQKDQLKRKDDSIRQMRDESVKEREESLKEITRLQKELAGETQRAMSKIISLGKDSTMHKGFPAHYTESGIRGLNEVETTLTVKDGKIKELSTKVEMYTKELAKKDTEIVALKNHNQDLEAKVGKLERDDKLSLTRQELEKTKKELAKKNTEYKGLKTTIEKLKQDFDTYSDKNIKQTADINALASREKQYDHEKAVIEQQLRTAQKELQQQTKVLNKAQEMVKESERKEKELKTELDRLTQELTAEKTLRTTLQKELSVSEAAPKSLPQMIPSVSHLVGPSEKELETARKEVEKLRKELASHKFGQISQTGELTVDLTKGTIEAKVPNKIESVPHCEEVIEKIKAGLNPRISPSDLFEAYAEGRPVVSEPEFITVCEKMGFTFDEVTKAAILTKVSKEGGVDYTSFVAAVNGKVDTRFFDEDLLRIAKTVVDLGISSSEILKTLTEGGSESPSKEATVSALIKLFKLDPSDKAIEYLLARTKLPSAETYGAKKLVTFVEKAANACLAESFNEMLVQGKHDPAMLFAELDSNRDQKLDRTEFVKLVQTTGMRLTGTNMDRLVEVFDQKGTGAVSFETYREVLQIPSELCIFSSSSRCKKKIIESDSTNLSGWVMKKAEEAKFRQDLSVISRRTARALMNGAGMDPTKLLENFAEADLDETGVMSLSEAVNVLVKIGTKEVKRADVAVLLKEMDPTAKGQFCYHNLARKIAEMAQTNVAPTAVLKRVLSVCVRKGAPVNTPAGFKQLFSSSADREGKINFAKFRVHLQSLVPGLTEDEFLALENVYRYKDSGKLDLKLLTDDLFSPQVKKPVVPVSEHKKPGLEKTSTILQEKSQPALKGKLEELKKENENLKKENLALSQRVVTLEKAEKISAGTLLGIPKAESKTDVRGKDLAGNVKQYSAKITELEKANYELLKKIDTEYKPVIAKHKSEIEKLKADIKFLKLDNLKLESQIEKMLKKPMDGVEKRHELEYLKDTKIAELQKKLDTLSAEQQKLEEKVFALEQGKLELQFEKENFGLERSRLERRIKDLEEFQAETKQ